MKNWIELCSDVCWEDYHGMWARKARDGRWYVLVWVNMWDACGESGDLHQYSCEVKALDLSELPEREIKRALDSCGYDADSDERCILESCIQYGLGAPLESFNGSKRPLSVRANARRFAEQCMRDAALLERRLDRPVNAIGSTAREYGAGDINAALYRGDDPEKKLMRKLHGIPEDPEFLRAVRGSDGAHQGLHSRREIYASRSPAFASASCDSRARDCSDRGLGIRYGFECAWRASGD